VFLLCHIILARAWTKYYIRELILKLSLIVENKGSNPQPTDALRANEERLFIHLQFNPDNLSHDKLDQLYVEYCGEPFQKEPGLGRPTIAYPSSPHSI